MKDQRLPIGEIWVYLSGSPLLALILTLSAYQIGLALYRRSGNHPLANPVAIAVLLVAIAIQALDMPYLKYFEGAQFVHFLLGTATVSLAVPIYRGLLAMPNIRARIFPLLAALLSGGVVSILSAVGVAKLAGVDPSLVSGLYAKSVTAPIAMGVAERVGASPTLTAVFAVLTGVLGAVIAKFVLDRCAIKRWWQRGFAIGVAAHGIGASRAFSVSQEAGAYASLAMGLHGILGALLIPLALKWIT
jgi:putative effector of murein hydrolase